MSMLDRKLHWQNKHSKSTPTEVSWYQAHPTISLRLIQETGIEKSDRIIDVGGGASTLIDYLLDAGKEEF